MRKSSTCGSAADGSIHRGSRAVSSADGGELVVIVPGVVPPSLNEVNRMHWSQKHRLRKFYRDLLDGSVSPLNVTGPGCLTMIILPEARNS